MTDIAKNSSYINQERQIFQCVLQQKSNVEDLRGLQYGVDTMLKTGLEDTIIISLVNG